MMSAPQPYPTVGANVPTPDDAQIQKKMPSICVDYLSHNWAQEDVWQSWKAMTKRKNEIANGVRLENASWRTWAKQRGNLKTINPETLNWLKDSDVTWLYGPLHEHADPVPPPKVASTADRLDLDDSMQKKSILKHRTISEMLTTPGRNASPAYEIHHAAADGALLEGDESTPKGPIVTVKSDLNLAARKRTQGSPPASERLLAHPSLERANTNGSGSEDKRHISFNTRVDQCIAVDYPEEEWGYSDGDFEEDSSDVESDASNEAELLTMKSSPKASASSYSGSSRQSSPSSDLHHIIAKLAPTRLKTSELLPSPSPQVVDPTGFASGGEIPGARVSSQPIGQYDSGFDTKSEWDDDAGAFDYFSTSPKQNPGSPSDEGDDDDHLGFSVASPGAGQMGGRKRAVSTDQSGGSSSYESATDPASWASNSAPAPSQPRSILKRRTGPTYDTQDAPSSDSKVGAGSAFLADKQVGEDAFNGSDDESARGRSSQRSGSSASYERIQDATRRSGRGPSTSGGSPSGSIESVAASISSSSSAGAGHNVGSPPERERRGSFRGRDNDGQQRLGAAARLQASEAASVSGVGENALESGDSSARSSNRSSDEEEEQHSQRGAASAGISAASTSSPGSAAAARRRGNGAPPSASSSGSNKSRGSPVSPAGSQRLSVDLDNLPSNDPSVLRSSTPGGAGGSGGSGGGQGGPTPLNTPTLALARSRGYVRDIKRSSTNSSDEDDDEDDDDEFESSDEYRPKNPSSSHSSSSNPLSPTIPRRSDATGAIVAPSGADRQAGVRVPLADDYVEEDEGGIIGRAVEIVNTARDLIAAVWPKRS